MEELVLPRMGQALGQVSLVKDREMVWALVMEHPVWVMVMDHPVLDL